MSQLLKTSEVAKMFRVSPRTIRDLIKKGELKAFRVGGEYRIDTEWILEMLKTNDKHRQPPAVA